MTTREYVHLVTGSYFRSRDKDGGHAIRSIVAENTMLHANFTAVCVSVKLTFDQISSMGAEAVMCGNTGLPNSVK